MIGVFRIVGYVIASADGRIADATGHMPASLKLEADVRFFENGLEHVDAVVHGRNSHEGHPNSHRRPTAHPHPRRPRARRPSRRSKG